MTETLIKYDTAVLAKEKGFDWIMGLGQFDMMGNEVLCSQSLLQKWLRDVKKQDIEVLTAGRSGYYYCFVTQTRNGYIYEGREIKEFPSYEEALEAGLLESLKLV